MTERDEEGFPVINDDTIGSVYVDEYEVAWVCEWIEGLDAFGWRSLGPVNPPPPEE